MKTKKGDKNIVAMFLMFAVIVLLSLNLYQYGKYQKKSAQLEIYNAKASQSAGALDKLNSKVRKYLDYEGNGCVFDTSSCLDSLLENYQEKKGADCSSLSDEVCPKWCAAGSDYDCCVEKGYEWIAGRGCYR